MMKWKANWGSSSDSWTLFSSKLSLSLFRYLNIESLEQSTPEHNFLFIFFLYLLQQTPKSCIVHVSDCVFYPKACGRFIETDSVGAAISSPLYPAKYPNNQNCSWIIRAQEPCK